jgi:uncharacterized protein (TIGR03905 family)
MPEEQEDIMAQYTYTTKGVCSRRIDFEIDDEKKLRNIKFYGGCAGNLQAISKLCDGKSAEEISGILMGNDCGGKGTSCADQFAKAIKLAMEDAAK